MAPELTVLGFVLVLAIVQILLPAHFKTKQYGKQWNMGARDAEMPPLDPVAGRLVRAQANLFETLPLFIGAVLAAGLANRFGALTAWGAHLYLFGRLIYLPLYAFGVPVIRSLAWGISMVGLLMVIGALLFG